MQEQQQRRREAAAAAAGIVGAAEEDEEEATIARETGLTSAIVPVRLSHQARDSSLGRRWKKSKSESSSPRSLVPRSLHAQLE